MNAFAAESAGWRIKGLADDIAAEAKSAALGVKAKDTDNLRQRIVTICKLAVAVEKAAREFDMALDDATVALPPEVAHV